MAQLSPSQQLLKNTLQTVKRAFIAVVGFSFCINMLMLAAPIYMLQIFDRVLSSRSTDTLLLLTFIIALAILTMAVLEAIRSQMMVKIGSWLDKQLADTVLSGSIANTLVKGHDPSIQGLRDLNTFRSFIGGNEIFPFLDAPWAPIFLIFVYLLHPWLGIAATIGAIILFSLAVLNEYITRAALAAASRANMQSMQFAESAVRNADVIDGMGMMPNLIARWQSLNQEGLVQQAKGSNRSAVITSTSKFIRLILQIVMLGTGAYLVILGELTPGGMIAGSILMSRALAPVEQAIGAWKSALAARGAFKRLKEQIITMSSRADSMPLPAPTGMIQVEGVSYIHPNQTETILRDLNFSIKPGQVMGLIGSSASGKTTLVRLLLGNIEPRLGHIRLDNMDVAKWNPNDLGQHCGYLPQDIELFSGTIKDNIARMGEGDPELVVNAAKLAGCHDMILRLPNGYDTIVGESGATLSGGERQRIALARAIYGEPKFVVLDEPNSSLDAIGEAALVECIRQLKEKAVTTVIIGHRPNVLQHVDVVMVLQEGKISDFGPKDEVFARLSKQASDQQVTEIKRNV